jgi:hypothetical protein
MGKRASVCEGRAQVRLRIESSTDPNGRTLIGVCLGRKLLEVVFSRRLVAVVLRRRLIGMHLCRRLVAVVLRRRLIEDFGRLGGKILLLHVALLGHVDCVWNRRSWDIVIRHSDSLLREEPGHPE